MSTNANKYQNIDKFNHWFEVCCNSPLIRSVPFMSLKLIDDLESKNMIIFNAVRKSYIELDSLNKPSIIIGKLV